jgi:hypothetical protein
MDIGMLWFDDSNQPFVEKINRAADFYQKKYGESPTLCLVNPSSIEGKNGAVKGVEVREARTVMPHHFYIGVDKDRKK